MKQFVLILTLFFYSTTFSFSQKYNAELLKSYSKEELKSFDEETIKVLEYGIENAIYYTQLPEGKIEQLGEINLSGNPTKYTDIGLKIIHESQYLKVIGTNHVLVVKSLYVLKNEISRKN